MIMLNSCLFSIVVVAPSGTVQHFWGRSLDSTRLQLTWAPPSALEQNGVIQAYKVYITETGSGNIKNYTLDSTNITIGHLHPYYTYSCIVSAVTVKEGPTSNPINITTLEDG